MSSDPLADLSERRLRRLARDADRFRRVDAPRFEAIALDLGLPTRRLRLLADAWAEGGDAGLVAADLRAGRPPPPGEVEAAAVQLEAWRRRHLPLDALDLRIEHDRVSAWILLPGADPTAPLEARPLLQLRVTWPPRRRHPRWHLYRWAADGWWPVVVAGSGRPQSVEDCLAAVLTDPLHQFWGVEGPRG